MARPTKQGLDYFPLDVDFFQDLKIRKIIRAYGDSATAILICILCMIYKDNGYYIKWDEDTAFIISEILNTDEEKISLVVSKAIEIDFFNKEVFSKFSILTSRAIQKRFQLIVKNSKLKRSKIEHNLNLLGVNTEEMGKSSEEMGKSSEKTPITSEESTQSKVKESKVKESKEKESKEKCVETHTQKIMTFQEKLSLFKEEYLNSGRFEKTCMTLNIRPDVLKKMFNEFTDAQECGSKHEGIVNYAEFSSQMSSHFFNTVKFLLKKENESKPRNGFNDTLDELLILNSN